MYLIIYFKIKAFNNFFFKFQTFQNKVVIIEFKDDLQNFINMF